MSQSNIVRKFKGKEIAQFSKIFKLEGKKITFPSSVWYPNGNIYRGQLNRRGKCDGLGIMYYKNGDILQAKWNNDLANGCGIFIWKDGTEAVGFWKNGHLHGKKNKIRFPSGSVYIGETELGVACGQGTMTTSDGDIFRGNWANNKLNGYAHINYANGDMYNGFMLDHEMCGSGIFHWANGNRYNGFWYKDALHGQGILDATGTTGEVYYGGWEMGQQL